MQLQSKMCMLNSVLVVLKRCCVLKRSLSAHLMRVTFIYFLVEGLNGCKIVGRFGF